jgi:hypothetical protein
MLYQTMDEKQKLAIRLQSELANFRERERLYIEKRKELQELEMKYRRKQD